MIARDWADRDLYSILGVTADARADDIADAFRSLAKRWHPDVADPDGPSAERFKEITAAYEVLGDPFQRSAYDSIRLGAPLAPHPSNPQPRGPSPVGRRHVPRWSRRRIRAVFCAGVASTIAGIGFGGFVIALQASERATFDDRVEVVGTAAVGRPELRLAVMSPGRSTPVIGPIPEELVGVEAGARIDTDSMTGEPFGPGGLIDAEVISTLGGAIVVFPHDGGLQVIDDPTSARSAALRDGTSVKLFVDRRDRTDVVVAESNGSRNVALWIVAIKLAVAGPLLVWYARVRGRPARTR